MIRKTFPSTATAPGSDTCEAALRLALDVRALLSAAPHDGEYRVRLARALNDSLVDELSTLARRREGALR